MSEKPDRVVERTFPVVETVVHTNSCPNSLASNAMNAAALLTTTPYQHWSAARY